MKTEQGAFACASESGYQQGLTKREYFAAMAMQGLCADPGSKSDVTIEYDVAAAVKYADALLAELEKPTNGSI